MQLRTTTLIFMILLLTANAVSAAEIEIFQNSHDYETGETLIQVQNSGDRDLHDLFVTIDDFSKKKSAALLVPHTSTVLITYLAPGEHLVKVETSEGITVEKKLVIGRSESQVIEENKANEQAITSGQFEKNKEKNQMLVTLREQAKKQLEEENARLEQEGIRLIEQQQQEVKLEKEKIKEIQEQENLVKVKPSEEQLLEPSITTKTPVQQSRYSTNFPIILTTIILLIIIIMYFVLKRKK